MENAQYLDASASAPGSADLLEASWHKVREKLKGEVGEVEYRTWLRQIVLGPIEDGELILYLPTRFLRDWVRSQYEERLQTLWRTERADVQGIELQVKRGLPEVPPSAD
ncbi:chromosomal replication initiation protein, partial [Gluconobacter japonicus]